MRKILIVIALCLPCSGQLWSGVLNSSRATDWTKAGLPGDSLPSSSWTQCGSTISAYTGNASTITTALAGCSANQYVLLGAGTFHINAGKISFPASGHVVLRGAGANSTFMVIDAGGGAACQISTSLICIQSSDQPFFNQPPPNIAAWTAGYSQTGTSITISDVSGTTLTAINTTAASNPTIIFQEQCETGLTAASVTAPCTGNQVDNNGLFVCAQRYTPGSPTVGCSSNGTGNENTNRGHFEGTVATAVNTGTGVVTIADPLKYPDWATGQKPRVWIQQSISQVGVENMSFDMSSNATGGAIVFFGAYKFWVSGCKFTNWVGWAINNFQSIHGLIKDSYFYHSTGSDSYAIRFEGTAMSLVQNNIITQVFAPVVFDGPSSGDVIAYNYVINDNYQSDLMRGSTFSHDVNQMDLYEGNVVNQLQNDGNHGSATMITRMRNLSLGWDSCANGQCGASTFKDSATNSFIDNYASRYENNVGNVMGVVGYHNTYEATSGNTLILAIGVGNGGVSPAVPTDPLSYSTSLFWGNYDTVTAGIRWCGNSSDTGWVAICGSASEVPTGAPTYPNSLPTLGDTGAGMGALPASFYQSSKPLWFGALAWPAIGPDVSSGNVGRCSGTLNTTGQQVGMPATNSSQCTGTSLTAAWGGHANATPAMNCYLSLGGPPDGSGSALSFDANQCYSPINTGPSPAMFARKNETIHYDRKLGGL